MNGKKSCNTVEYHVNMGLVIRDTGRATGNVIAEIVLFGDVHVCVPSQFIVRTSDKPKMNHPLFSLAFQFLTSDSLTQKWLFR